MVRGPNSQLKISGVGIDSAERVFFNKIDLHSRLRGCKLAVRQLQTYSFHPMEIILDFGLQRLINLRCRLDRFATWSGSRRRFQLLFQFGSRCILSSQYMQ
ncbi:hypothetical protein QL093DRAFT_2405904 [Fusarium oxysporum]|nr:hypothetical protein QL093DRAFT_2405904 [Fusarium oxysporum]